MPKEDGKRGNRRDYKIRWYHEEISSYVKFYIGFFIGGNYEKSRHKFI